MTTWEKLLQSIRNNPGDVRFADALKVAERYFGKPRIHGSHRKFSVPWSGEPEVNLQEGKNGKAKAYQVRQLIAAIERAEGENGEVQG